jgi:transglutaminase-like putative cysteine protease
VSATVTDAEGGRRPEHEPEDEAEPKTEHEAEDKASRKAGRTRSVRPWRQWAWPVYLQLVVIALLTVLAGASFTSAFEARFLLPMMAAAGCIAVVATAVVRGMWTRRAGLLVPLVGFVGFVVFAMVVATKSPAPRLLIDGIENGWARILTAATPVDAIGPNLVLPLLTVWVVGVLSTELLLRARTVVWSVFPPVIGMCFGAAFGVGDPLDAFGRKPMALILVAIFGLLLLRTLAEAPGATPVPGSSSRSSVALRRLGAGIPIVLVATLAGVLLGPKLPLAGSRPPLVLRDHYDEQARVHPIVNPMALLAAAERDAAQAEVSGTKLPSIFVVDTSQPVERYRLASLDVYDGLQWSTTATYTTAGHNLPPAVPPIEADTVPTDQSITIGTVPGGFWLPAADRPVTVSRGDLLFDPVSGTLATTAPTTGLSYTVRSAVPSYDLDSLKSAEITEGPAAAPYLATPAEVPDDLRALAAKAMTSSTFQLQQVYDLQQYLKVNYQLLPSDQARPGHSLDQIDQFLTNPDYSQGSPEQFAAAFALLARVAGIPSRVVVGYKGNGQAGEQVVTSADMTIWPEVLFDGLGWVPFDPTPSAEGTDAPPDQPTQGQASTGDVIAQAAAPTDQSDDTSADTTDESAAPLTPLAVVGRSVAAGAAVVLVAAGLLTIVTGTMRRRRVNARRRARDPRAQIEGAWDETVDLLAESRSSRAAGLPRRSRAPVEALTAAEVVAAGTGVVGDEAEPALRQLATLANAARYGGAEPTEADAATAWSTTDALRTTWSRSRSFRDKLRHRLDPRTARRRSGRARRR